MSFSSLGGGGGEWWDGREGEPVLGKGSENLVILDLENPQKEWGPPGQLEGNEEGGDRGGEKLLENENWDSQGERPGNITSDIPKGLSVRGK